MGAITEDMLMAYLDGELDELSRSRVERTLAADPALCGALEGQKRLKARLAQRFDPVLEEEVPDRLRAMLETNVVPLASRRSPAVLPWPQAAAMAATFVLGLVGAGVLSEASGTAGTEGSAMIAKGDLAQALDRQLAADRDAPTKVGVSFAAHDGRFCRTFENAELAGLACRGSGRWDLVTTTRVIAPGAGDYRQAGSGSALVMQAAQELMAGEPLDANAERRARDAGWRAESR